MNISVSAPQDSRRLREAEEIKHLGQRLEQERNTDSAALQEKNKKRKERISLI